MRCILCGGDHEPQAELCNQNPSGMDCEIKRMGAIKWTRLSGLVMQRKMPPEMREWLRSLRAVR